MPWFSLRSDSIPRFEIEAACARLLDEARTCIKRDLRRVLLLPHLGGKDTTCASRLAAGVHGNENNLSNLRPPLRACYN